MQAQHTFPFLSSPSPSPPTCHALRHDDGPGHLLDVSVCVRVCGGGCAQESAERHTHKHRAPLSLWGTTTIIAAGHTHPYSDSFSRSSSAAIWGASHALTQGVCLSLHLHSDHYSLSLLLPTDDSSHFLLFKLHQKQVCLCKKSCSDQMSVCPPCLSHHHTLLLILPDHCCCCPDSRSYAAFTRTNSITDPPDE